MSHSQSGGILWRIERATAADPIQDTVEWKIFYFLFDRFFIYIEKGLSETGARPVVDAPLPTQFALKNIDNLQ
jgi:hypothetical protein